MKRYINLSMAPVNMAENESGYWCKYSDVKDLEEQNTENERIINSLYGSSDSKILEELKTVESDDAFKGGYKSMDPEVKKLREALAEINNQRKNQDSYKLLVNIFEIANNALKAEELDK